MWVTGGAEPRPYGFDVRGSRFDYQGIGLESRDVEDAVPYGFDIGVFVILSAAKNLGHAGQHP